jgi:hypothetical protein
MLKVKNIHAKKLSVLYFFKVGLCTKYYYFKLKYVALTNVSF